MILINGEYNNSIHIADRGFQYGDGLFETIEVSNGKPVFLQQHLYRLELGCTQLKIPLPDSALLTAEIKQLCDGIESAVLKIIITRGVGGRGYCPSLTTLPTRVLSIHPYPDYPSSYVDFGVRVRFCQTMLGMNPALAGIKHLNRLEQVMSRAEWDDPDIQEGLLSDFNGHIIEGTMSNVFYIKAETLYTPSLKYCGVEGIIKAIIMQLCQQNGVNCNENEVTKENLLCADQAFVCNSIIGIWPIKQLDEKILPVGGLILQIQQWFNQFKAKDLANAL